MKSFKKLLVGSAIAVSAMSAQAALILPSTGAGELMAVVYTVNNNNSFVLDLGITITNFNTSNNQSFNLAASPYWSTFITNSVGNTPIQFGVIGADSDGLNTGLGSKSVFLTASPGSSVGTLPSNNLLATRANNVASFQNSLNEGITDIPAFQGNHSTVTDGSSLDTTASTATSGALLGAGNPNLSFVNAGTNAELFRISTSAGNGNQPAALTDFFSSTETNNDGGYFSLNTSTGVLDYFGAPGAVVNPVPEASEWAMMLSGLGMLGLMVRRRRSNI
jgi:hypothetical protein